MNRPIPPLTHTRKTGQREGAGARVLKVRTTKMLCVKSANKEMLRTAEAAADLVVLLCEEGIRYV